MNEEPTWFFIGMFAGVMLFVFALVVSNATPTDTARRIYGEAVQHGHGKWIIDTNNFDGSNPKTKFEWNK